MNTLSPTAAVTHYRHTQVLTASGVQLIVLLYDSAIQAIELASDGMTRQHQPDKARFLGRAVGIVSELSSVLDFERGGEIATSLYTANSSAHRPCRGRDPSQSSGDKVKR